MKSKLGIGSAWAFLLAAGWMAPELGCTPSTAEEFGEVTEKGHVPEASDCADTCDYCWSGDVCPERWIGTDDGCDCGCIDAGGQPVHDPDCDVEEPEPEAPSDGCTVGGFGALGCAIGDCTDVPGDGCAGTGCPGRCRDLTDAAPCDGVAVLVCPDPTSFCVDDPRDACDPQGSSADCIGVCIDDDPPEPAPSVCGGLANIQCAEGQICVEDPAESCDDTDTECMGICVDEEASEDCTVGGFGALGCTIGDCVDLPNDDCDGLDCPGVCRDLTEAAFCGGLGNISCNNDGEICLDDPRDGCTFGVGDCGGICVAL